MAEETQTQDAPAKAPKAAAVKGWDRKVRHMGTFTDFRKREFPAYLEFQDTDDTTRGFALFCVSTHKEFKPGQRVLNAEHLKLAKINFIANGKTESIEKPKAKAISKAKRNAAMAAAAPKVESDEE